MGVLDTVGGLFSRSNPDQQAGLTLVKTLGVAALSVAMSHQSKQQS